MTQVLIVDDKEENLYYLSALLTGNDCTVETARHGAEALVKARRTPPDIVISDLLMPVMDGYTLLRHWKSDIRLKPIPFVVYTATYTDAEDERLAINLGADAFILKPAEPEEFLARIRAVQAKIAAPKITASHSPPVTDENAVLKLYSETLIRKLEEKTLQLEEMNQALQQDITERKRTESELRESEERFRATFEQAAVGIAHVSTDGTFMRVNDKLCAIMGFSRDEFSRLTYTALAAPDHHAAGHAARLAMLSNQRDSYSAEKRYRRKNGQYFWGRVVTTLLRDATGEPKYFISVIEDITERKSLEEQVLRAQRMESIGTLAGGIAHDLNNLLAPILMGVGLLSRMETSAQSQRIIAGIERSASRGAELVKQVLSFSRGVEGARVAVDLGHIIHEVKTILHNGFPKNIALHIDIPERLRLVMGDPTQITQVLLNLCVNARDAMTKGGHLTVIVRDVELDALYAAHHRDVPPGQYVRLEVSDTGCGIAPEIISRIFEPFFTTKDLSKGTGLGLSTAVGIVRSHGGFVNVSSEVGVGSVFEIYFPAQADANITEHIEPDSEALPRGEGELILVVDDESAIVNVAKQILEMFGYRVLTALDGAEALQLYKQHAEDIALVITDVVMPIMDGPTLMAALRRIDSKVRIIASSGNSTVLPDTECECFLPKPYSAGTLLTLARKVLSDGAPIPMTAPNADTSI
jgi:two-component system cell cycle sensor histidine kinase/response regulator CckA